MSIDEDLERGAQAARILTSPIYQQAYESVEAAIHELWAACPIRDLEGQQTLRLQLQLLKDLRAVFDAAVEDGRVAKEKLEAANRRSISPRDWKYG